MSGKVNESYAIL